jgi:hypothetical protein
VKREGNQWGRLFEGSAHVKGADLINQAPLCNALWFGPLAAWLDICPPIPLSEYLRVQKEEVFEKLLAFISMSQHRPIYQFTASTNAGKTPAPT